MLAALSISSSTFADDLWLVRFSTPGGATTSGRFLYWADRIHFFNTGSEAATVRLTGVSNGAAPPTPSELTIPPSESRIKSSPLFFLDSDDWRPTGDARIWVVKLDVPDGTIVASAGELLEIDPSLSSQPPGIPREGRGNLPFPVFRQLVAAGSRQVHLGTAIGAVFDVGTNGYRVISNRINVGVFNAASVEATALIAVRRACDNAVIQERAVSIAPNSIVQFGGFANSGAPACGSVAPADTYVTVTSDQPGFSYAMALSNEQPLFFTAGVGGGT